MTLDDSQIQKLMLYLRIDNQLENGLVEDLGNAALSWCERYCDGTFQTDPLPAPETPLDSEYLHQTGHLILFTPEIWQAVMILTAYWYANREAAFGPAYQQPFTVTAIIDRYRIFSDS